MNHPVLVIDTNKILASILRPGRVRRLLFTAQAVIITPAHAWREAGEKMVELAAKKGVNPRELAELLDEVRKEVIVEEEPRQPYPDLARNIASSFDPDDWPFIALALQRDAPIWTNDQELIRNSLRRGEYRALDTRGVEMFLEGKPWREIEEYLKERYGQKPRL